VIATPLGSAPRNAAQSRIIYAALDLFANHGVSATSLQMIADAIGVSKAAVYHQFNTKEEIVVATVEVELSRFEPALEAAEVDAHNPRALELLIVQLVDRAVERRRMVISLQQDPVVVRLLAEYEPFQRFMDRLYRLMIGPKVDAQARVRAAMALTSIGGAVTHPLTLDLEDDVLQSELLQLTRKLFDLTGVTR
jgi:AcrR family transcriptional regulator